MPRDLIDHCVRAAYDDWPHKVISQALAEATGLPMNATIDYDTAINVGMNPFGLRRTVTAVLAALDRRAPVEGAEAHRIASIGVYSMHESCERTTFYVRATTSEGLTKDVDSHRTGSIYTNGEGLSIEEARDRALIDAATWGDFLGIEPEPYVDAAGVKHEPSMEFRTYEYQRARHAVTATSEAER